MLWMAQREGIDGMVGMNGMADINGWDAWHA